MNTNTRSPLALVAGALVSIIAWLMTEFTTVEIPPFIAASATTVVIFLLQTFMPEDALDRLRGKKSASLLLLMFFVGGCAATTECNTIYSRGRTARAVAIATGAGGIAGGLGTIPLEGKEARIAVVSAAAAATVVSVTASYLAGSYADEYLGYCGTSSTAAP